MIISNLPFNKKLLFRKLEKLMIKEGKFKSSLSFNNSCIINKFLPKYVNNKIKGQLIKIHQVNVVQKNDSIWIILQVCFVINGTNGIQIFETHKIDGDYMDILPWGHSNVMVMK